MASVCRKTHTGSGSCAYTTTSTRAEKRRRGGPPGSRVMAEAIALYFSYTEPQYAKIQSTFVSPGPDAFFSHVARLECEYRASISSKRRSVRFAAMDATETTAEFAAFLDYLVDPNSNRLSDRVHQALLIAERALAGYVYLLGKDECEDWPRSHLIQPLTWFLKLLLPAAIAAHEKIMGSELKHVAELIIGINDVVDPRPIKIFKAIQKIQALQSFDDFYKLVG